MSDDLEQRQSDLAAAEAAQIGGNPGKELTGVDGEPIDEAELPVVEAGEGEAEGLEMADAELVDNASHGDQHAAGRVLEDAPAQDEDERAERHEDDRPADR